MFQTTNQINETIMCFGKSWSLGPNGKGTQCIPLGPWTSLHCSRDRNDSGQVAILFSLSDSKDASAAHLKLFPVTTRNVGPLKLGHDYISSRTEDSLGLKKWVLRMSGSEVKAPRKVHLKFSYSPGSLILKWSKIGQVPKLGGPKREREREIYIYLSIYLSIIYTYA